MDPSPRNLFSTLVYYLGWLIAATFILLGVGIVFYGREYMKVSALASVSWGVFLTGYGIFRARQLYQRQRAQSTNGFPLVLLALMLSSCSNGRTSAPTDTATSGRISIAVDESMKPLIETEVEVFEGIYSQAKINVIYTTEKDAVESLLKDSVRCAIITRTLAPEEAEVLTSQKIYPKSVKVATDAIALIRHPRSKDTLFTVQQLKEKMTSKIAPGKAKVEFVFDSRQSGMARYLQDSLLESKECVNCFAVNSNPAVIEYVASHPDAIGFIGVEWIKSKNDSIAGHFMNQVKVAYLKSSDSTDYQQPYQAYIALKQYPLLRNVFIVSREARTGLGSGFLSFVASDRGQRIILKSGLVPATMPVRLVEFKKKNLQLP